MEIEQENRYCEYCQSETWHDVVESALEIEYKCKECGEVEKFYKTFF
jgi:uncharacterized Zn finger protein